MIEKWDKFWFRRFDPLGLCLFRIFMGALIFSWFLCIYPNWERFYSAGGLMSHVDFTPTYYEKQTSLLFLTSGKVDLIYYWWIGVIASLFFTIGLFTRFFTIVLYLLVLSLGHYSTIIINGEDLLFQTVLFYSCFAPTNYSLSVDELIRKKMGKPKKELPTIWATRSMQINVVLIYLFSVYNKLIDDVAWQNGEALYYSLLNETWGKFPFPKLLYMNNHIFSTIGTHMTILMESLFPLIWFRKARAWVVIMFIGFHLIIGCLMPPVLFFSLSMIATYWIYFSGDEIRKAFKALRL